MQASDVGVMQRSTGPALVASLLGFALASAAIAGAWFFQLALDLVPCPLCLQQRWPYYIGLPVIALALVLLHLDARRWARLSLGLAALIFIVGAGMGAYHAGVEWGLWTGPNDCAAGAGTPQSAGGLLQQMARTRVVPCDEAAWRLFGISLAGYNALVSLAVAGLAAMAYRRA